MGTSKRQSLAEAGKGMFITKLSEGQQIGEALDRVTETLGQKTRDDVHDWARTSLVETNPEYAEGTAQSGT